MRVTRKMVAERSGVSEQTVSYVINKSRKLSPATVKKVEEAIKYFDYSPDMIAVSMATKRTKTVGIILDDMENPIFPSIVNGFQEAAFEKGYSTYICNLNDEEHIDAQISQLIAQRVEGVYITLSFNERTLEIIEKLKKNNIKVILGNKNRNYDTNYPVVRVDFNQGMREILTFLKEKGHKEIVYVSGLDSKSLTDSRYFYFKSIYKEIFNIEPKTIKNESPYHTGVSTGKRLAEKCLQTYPETTCIVTTNDLMAYGVIDYIDSIGRNVPNDVSVVGIDNIPFSKYTKPSLTSLGYDCKELGKISFDVLFDEIEGKEVKKEYTLNSYIVERSSIKKL